MSAAEDSGWLAPNQNHGIARQLDDGIRALLIDDTHYGSPGGRAVLTDLGAEDVTREELEDVLGAQLLAVAERLRDELVEAAPGEARPYLCHVLCELGEAQAGVHGSRLTGAGFGGCVLHLAAAGQAEAALEGIRRGFERRFSRRPRAWVLRTGRAASVLELPA